MQDRRPDGPQDRSAGHRPTGSEPDLSQPLDAADPRFTGARRVDLPPHRRELVESQGPGASPMDSRVRLLRGVIPALALVALVAVGAALFRALAPGPSVVVLGEEQVVRAAVAEAPQRVCREEDGMPCAWLTSVDGRLLALSTSGASPEEFGRQGVGWCPSSGYFGSDAAGTRYDHAGNVVTGSAPRGLDRYGVRVRDGQVAVDFGSRTAGRRAGGGAVHPPAGDPCPEIPYRWDADLDLDAVD